MSRLAILGPALGVAALTGGARLQTVMVARQARARLGRGGGRTTVAGGGRRARLAPATVLLGVGGVVAAALAGGPPAVAVLVLAGAALPVAVHVRARAARRTARVRQLPVALERLATSLRSGASLPVALDEAGRALDPPLGPELAAVGAATRRGLPVGTALDAWSAAHGDPGTRLAATALVLADIVGSTPARAVDGVAATLRERLDLAAERKALAVQARTSSLVLSVAPVAFAAVLVLADTAAAGFLLGSPAGAACLAAGVGLDALGAWWMARLCRSDGP